MIGADVAARYLIELAYSGEEPDGLTPLRLQKLLYYVQGWSLALRGRPLFADPLEAWPHGPVVPSVYQEYKNYGNGVIPPNPNEAIDLGTSDRELIAVVWKQYAKYSATRLRDMTHAESPWKTTRGTLPAAERSNDIISQESIKEFFDKEMLKQSAGGPNLGLLWRGYDEYLAGGVVYTYEETKAHRRAMRG